MADGLKIALSEAASAVIAKMGDAPGMLAAVAEAMDAQNQLTITHISEARMRGNNGEPFPPALHILGIRTGHLYQSLTASDAAVTGGTVESSIGSNIPYAAIHEFGGTITMPARKGTVRLRTEKGGGLMRQPGFPNLAVFGRRVHKRAREVAYEAGPYEIEMPERAPVRTGIADRKKEYGEAVSAAIVEWFNTQN